MARRDLNPIAGRSPWDVLLAILGWLMLAIGPIESIYENLAVHATLLPTWVAWLVSGGGATIHVLRIAIPALLSPAQGHNVGAILLVVLGAVAAVLSATPPASVIQDQDVPAVTPDSGPAVGLNVEYRAVPDTLDSWAHAASRTMRNVSGSGVALVGCGPIGQQIIDALRVAYDKLVPCLTGIGMTAALDTASQEIHTGTVDGGPITATLEAGALGCAVQAGLDLLTPLKKDREFGSPRELTFVLAR